MEGLPAMPQLTTWSMRHFPNLNSLAGLPEMKAVLDWTIKYCEVLADLRGMPELPKLYRLSIGDMPGMTSTTGMSQVGSECEVTLENMLVLESLEGFAGIEEIWRLSIINCKSLVGLQGLESLRRIVSMLNIGSNDSLADVSALAGVIDASTAWVGFGNNPSLDQCVVLDMVSNWGCNSLSVGNNGPCQ